ncbi:hypothetical protein [Phyllobacterium lublinensis]|uniref:hypothetical protein n=1 Tax=Phyllobacterium lublinensis TaxID=2875708 RepID=UPI001CCF4A79|nr:hypothetical protein [Phyllobacterium sp. 2063]MBZ9654020.1 hypothetical protein [Phyllobacterium sp. 2063]
MPQKKKRQNASADEHTFLAIRVDRYEVSVDAAINYNLYSPETAWDLDDGQPIYKFTTRLTVVGVATYPPQQKDDTYEFTIYGNDLGPRNLHATLKDVQARDEHGSLRYRTYRGRQIPIYIPPKGIAFIDKVRGERWWTASLWVLPNFASDLLVVLSSGRPMFLAVDAHKSERSRWIRSLSLQTTDPANE